MDDVESELWLARDKERESMEKLAADEKAITREVCTYVYVNIFMYV